MNRIHKGDEVVVTAGRSKGQRGHVLRVVGEKVLVENVAILSFLGGGFASKGLWPAKTWDQAQALSFMAWLADTVHPAFAHLFRPERYVEGPACADAVKAGGFGAREGGSGGGGAPQTTVIKDD